MEVLRTKHLDAHPPSAASLETYQDRPQELVPLDITNDTVTEVAGLLSGGADPGGGGISEPSALSPAFWSGERGVVADVSRLREVVR